MGGRGARRYFFPTTGVAGGGGGIVISTFTQSVAGSLLANGDFETGDPPANWTLGQAILSSQADPRTGSAGAKCIRVARNGGSSPLATQAVVVVSGAWYELVGWQRKENCQSVYCYYTNPTIVMPTTTSTSWTCVANVGRRTAASTSVQVRLNANLDGLYGHFDDLTLGRITLNAQASAPSADSIITFSFALPASPCAGMSVRLLYRISGTAEDASASYWDMYLVRDAANAVWGFNLDSIYANTRTNRITVADVGSPTAMRVSVSGTKHNCFTFSGGVYTQRGAEVDLDFLTTSVGVVAVYSTGTTPTQINIT